MTDDLLLKDGIQHSLHCSFNIIYSLVDYLVESYINAFSLGALMVNPRATVNLKWTTLKEEEKRSEMYREFFEDNIDYISDQDICRSITGEYYTRG